MAVIDSQGTVTAYSSAGKVLYSAGVPGADHIVISPDGKYAMTYTALDRKNTTCTFIDSHGDVCWDLNVRGAVWSADACTTEDGSRFVIGTGDKRVYVADIGKRNKNYRWWTAPGAVVSLDIDTHGKELIVGTWQKSSVERREIDGTKLWCVDADNACLPKIQILGNSDQVSVLFTPNRRTADGSYMIIGPDGQLITQGNTDSAKNTRVLFDSTGKYVCLGYTEHIDHKGNSMVEKRAVLQDISGRQLWKKGSAFFQAAPILVTSHGEVLLRDSKNSLFITNPSGELESVLKCSGKFLDSASASNGSFCAIHCSDGKLYILKLS